MILDNSVPELNMGQKLKMLRELNNLSQERLGVKLNVTDKTISAWETGEREINLSNAKAICELFGISNSYFVFNENFNSLSDTLKKQIRSYAKNLDFRAKVEKLLITCKKKLESDGLSAKKEYLPVFDFENNYFVSYGIFDQNKLPIKAVKQQSSDRGCYDISGINDSSPVSKSTVDDSNLENINCYVYNSAMLAQFGLTDILLKSNSDKVELSDLINCNSLEAFKFTLEKTKSKKYIEGKSYYNAGRDVSAVHLQSELNKTLENLNPNLSKFWEIIIFLIDNGAYYAKQVGSGSDVVCWYEHKDVSKTNLVYRIAKDKISK